MAGDKQNHNNNFLGSWVYKFGAPVAFVLIVGVLGGIKLFSSKAYSGAHAECSNFTLTSHAVQPKQAIRANYLLTNDGSTSWSTPAGYSITDKYGKFSFSYGNKFGTGTVHAPSTKPFAVATGLVVPSSTGTYTLQLEVYWSGHGGVAIACPAQSVTVQNPPHINSFNINPSSITRGSKAKISWSTNTTSCVLNTTKVGYSGSLYVNPGGTSIYTLKCSNALGTVTGSLKLTVTAPPSGGGIYTPPPTHSGGSSTPTKDTKAPSVPDNFVASNNTDSGSVDLSWNASTDNVGVTGYEVDSSQDQKTWNNLTSSLTATSYQDSSAAFSSTYYYRVRAFDAAGHGRQLQPV